MQSNKHGALDCHLLLLDQSVSGLRNEALINPCLYLSPSAQHCVQYIQVYNIYFLDEKLLPNGSLLCQCALSKNGVCLGQIELAQNMQETGLQETFSVESVSVPFQRLSELSQGHLFLQTQEIEGNFSFAFTFCLEFGLPPPNLQSGDCVLFSLEF